VSYHPDDLLWHEESDPKDAAKRAISTAKAIEMAQAARRRRNLMHARLYANQDLQSIYDFGVADVYDGGVYLTFNVIQSCIDTVAAKIGRSRPRAQFLTERGVWSLKKQSRDLTQLVDGILDANDWHANEAARVFVDATLFGSGAPYVCGDSDTDEVVVERVVPDELLFDETEAMHGLRGLWNLFRKKHIHRQVLLRLFPKAAAAIKRAKGARPGETEGYTPMASEMIPVWHGWHRASKRGADDGRYIVAIEDDDGVLTSKKWKRTTFPFPMWSWQPPIVGMWGRSLAEELLPLQMKIKDLIEVIDEGQKLMCVPRLYVQDGLVNEDHIQNLVASVVKVSGSPQSAVYETVGKGASPEMYQDLQTWIERAFQKTGISQLSASAEKPEGVGSAVAMRELLDREDMRFATVGQRWEQFHVRLAECIVDTADELYQDRKVSVQVPGEKFLKSIDWKRVDLGKNRFIVRVMPVSSMPTTPGAKKQYVRELYEDQAIDKAQYLQLLELPDTASTVSLITSTLDIVDRSIELMVEDGTPQRPEPYSDLSIARARVMQAYLVAKLDGAPEKRLDLMRRYVARCNEMLEPPEAPQQPGAMPAPMPPMPPGPMPPGPPGPMPGPLPEGVGPALGIAAPEPVPPVPPVM
jgi:hypothetical protein